jgi:hypothetical protein
MQDSPLQRRDLLKLAAGAAAGAAVAGIESGCATTPPARPAAPPAVADVAARLDPAAADAMLAHIDRRLAWIHEASLPEDVLPLSRVPRGAAFDERVSADGALIKKSIRSLYLTGRFLDMPDEMKVHPGVQSRVQAMQSDMDDAVLGMTSRLERMTADDHRKLQAYLQKDEKFGERLASVIERPAKEDGLSFQRTFGVRSSILELTRRMGAQSPSLVTDPLVSKVRRIEASPRSDAEEARRMAARVGENAFWAHQERLAVLHQAWAMRLGKARALASNDVAIGAADTAPSASDSALPPPAPSASASPIAPSPPASPASGPPAAPHPTTGGTTMKAGGIIMGFGAASVVVGLILAGINGGFTAGTALGMASLVLGVTVGPILLAVGLIVVIVGAIIHAVE